jgi:hypothetical protein
MIWRRREPRLTEMLADPIIQALMAADGVDSNQLSLCLEKSKAKINRRPQDGQLGQADDIVGALKLLR